MFERSFISSIGNKDISPKLRTYRLFKINYIHEPYLHLIIPKYRVSLCRLRTSSHLLEIEKGRHTIPKTPLERRVCRQCDSNCVEDEIHFVVNCQKHTQLRTELSNIASIYMSNYFHLNSREKFTFLLSSTEKEVILALAKYCYWAYKHRI